MPPTLAYAVKARKGKPRLKTALLTSLLAPSAQTGVRDLNLAEKMVASKIYRDYESAFSSLTGMPLAFQPVDSWQLPHHGKPDENALCRLMTEKSGSCSFCLQAHDQLNRLALKKAKTMTCALGLSDSAVPVRLNNRVIGFFQVGQVFRTKPTARQFKKVLKLAKQLGIKARPATLKKAFYSGRVLTPAKYAGAINLLKVFAQHLGSLSHQIFIQQNVAELKVITKARTYIHDHLTDQMKLGEVARAVNMSTFYFCKTFKRYAGINFTDYVSRVRIEKAKNLLLNPNLRVSEIAFEIGFQSLTHFNRRFYTHVGLSPSKYREQLAH